MTALTRGAIAVAVILAGAGLAHAQQPALKVGYGAFTAPIAFLPNATADNFATLDPAGAKAQGAMVEALAAIAKDAGLTIQFVPFGPGGSGGSGGGGGGYGVGGTGQTAALNAKDVDLVLAPYSATTPDAATALAYAVSKPVFTTSDGLIAKKTDTTQYKTWPDLTGEVIGTLVGTITDGPLQMSMLFKEVKTFDTLDQVAEAVNAGQVRAAIVPGAPNLAYLLQQGKYPNVQLVKTFQPKFVFNVAIGVRTGDPNLAAIDKSLAKLKADGALRTIFAKYAIDSYLSK